jgi:hypothetical protein
MGFEEEFGSEIPDDAASAIMTVATPKKPVGRPNDIAGSLLPLLRLSSVLGARLTLLTTLVGLRLSRIVLDMDLRKWIAPVSKIN